MSEDNLKRRIEDWKAKGKKENEITYGMVNDGFQSIAGIPDNFYSAEDPADRARLWEEHQQMENKKTTLYDGDLPFYRD